MALNMNTPPEDFDDIWRENAKKAGMCPRKQGNETWGVVAPDDWLRGCLLFDRIWIPWYISPQIPGSFCDYDADNEIMGRQLGHRLNELRSMGLETEPNVDGQKTLNDMFISGLTRSIRYVAEVYGHKGYNVIPLYGMSERFDNEFGEGLQIGYEASLNTISIVAPENLTIEQVIDFREDAEAVRQYRSLRLWLRDGLKAQSVEHATDIMSQKLEAYEWAIRKHGLKTLTGALSAVVDSKTLIAIASGAGLTALMAGPMWAALASGLLVCSRSLAWIAERQIDLSDMKRGQNSEVAIFYTMGRRFSKNRKRLIKL